MADDTKPGAAGAAAPTKTKSEKQVKLHGSLETTREEKPVTIKPGTYATKTFTAAELKIGRAHGVITEITTGDEGEE